MSVEMKSCSGGCLICDADVEKHPHNIRLKTVHGEVGIHYHLYKRSLLIMLIISLIVCSFLLGIIVSGR